MNSEGLFCILFIILSLQCDRPNLWPTILATAVRLHFQLSVAARRPFALCLEIYLSARRSPLCMFIGVCMYVAMYIWFVWNKSLPCISVHLFLSFIHLFVLFWRLKLKFNSVILQAVVVCMQLLLLALVWRLPLPRFFIELGFVLRTSLLFSHSPLKPDPPPLFARPPNCNFTTACCCCAQQHFAYVAHLLSANLFMKLPLHTTHHFWLIHIHKRSYKHN